MRIVGLELEGALNWALLIRGVNLDYDRASLTRLDDFVEIKVCGRTSARGNA